MLYGAVVVEREAGAVADRFLGLPLCVLSGWTAERPALPSWERGTAPGVPEGKRHA